jgi:hypothetical protein
VVATFTEEVAGLLPTDYCTQHAIFALSAFDLAVARFLTSNHTVKLATYRCNGFLSGPILSFANLRQMHKTCSIPNEIGIFRKSCSWFDASNTSFMPSKLPFIGPRLTSRDRIRAFSRTFFKLQSIPFVADSPTQCRVLPKSIGDVLIFSKPYGRKPVSMSSASFAASVSASLIATSTFVLLANFAHAQATARSWLSAATSQQINSRSPVDAKRAIAQYENAREATLEVMVDVDELFSHAKDELREITVNDGKVLRVAGKRVVEGQFGARTWVGAVIDEGREYDVFVTALDGHVVGQIKTASSEYELRQLSPGSAGTLVDLAKAGATRFISLERDYVMPPVLEPRTAEDDAKDQKRRIDEKAKPTPQSTIDLLVFYNTDFTTRHVGTAGALTRINNLIAQANVAYDRSDVAITLRLVGTQATTYSNSTSNNTALNAMTPAQRGLAPEFANINSLRDAVGADLVALIRPFDSSAHAGCGIAWVGGGNQSRFSAEYGYAVISEGPSLQGGGAFCTDSTTPHELGHNMGLMHDRQTVLNQNGGAIEFGATNYGFGYVIPGSSPSVGDIMSYSSRGVNCFSSPSVFRQGPVVGTSGGNCGVSPSTGDVLGAAVGTTNSADAAAALNFARVTVSNFRGPVAPPVGITISGTVTNGGSAVPGVTFCMGGATGITCAVTNASTGAYSCTVPSGWTGSIHPRAANVRIPAQRYGSAVTASVSFNFAAQSNSSFPTCNLDIDNNGLLEANVDGAAIMRRLSGVNQTSLTALAGVCAQSSSAAHDFATQNSFNFNVTGGPASLASADGLIILRAMRDQGASSINGAVEAGAARTTWAQIASTLNTTCGTNF